jgi:predicted ATPase
MADVHEHLKELRDRANPLELVADRIATQTRVICFDELAVNDIADAMILGTLFAALFARGVTLAATSNIEPGLLYKDGLQRQRFVPTIALLRKHCEILHVDGAIDYRLRVLERADVYQTPNGPAADAHLAEYFDAIAPDEGDRAARSRFSVGRSLLRAADGVIWFDFAAICDGPRSQDDYIELSRLYQTVLVSNVPRSTRCSRIRRAVSSRARRRVLRSAREADPGRGAGRRAHRGERACGTISSARARASRRCRRTTTSRRRIGRSPSATTAIVAQRPSISADQTALNGHHALSLRRWA